MRHYFLFAALLVVLAGTAPGCKKSKPSEPSDSAPPEAKPPSGPATTPSPTGSQLSFSTPIDQVKPFYPESDTRTRLISSNNLKQIGLAWQIFHDKYSAFPAGVYDKSGSKVGLSWRVAILPNIEQDKLYKQFKLDEPWDSENNKKLIPLMPRTYAPPGTDGKAGLTYYRSIGGPNTVLPPVKRGTPGQPAIGVSMIQIPDGTANTMIVLEAGQPIEWTRPDDLEYVPGKPLPAVGGLFGDGLHIATADGFARFLAKKSVTPELIKGLITVNGGEVFQFPK
jgi:Protein of unknown function (DUF1559)